MKYYVRKGLNIKRLLELGDLDIRGAARGGIFADDFFAGVEQFIEDSQRLTDILLKISYSGASMGEPGALTERGEMLTGLLELKNTLKKIGYNQLDLAIEAICGAIEADNLQLAGTLAAEAHTKLCALVERTAATYPRKRPAGLLETESADNSTATVTLAEALKYLDYEEVSRKLRILAVDDVSVVLNALTSILSPYYEVFALKSGLQVEKFLTHTTPELFLLDIEMNDMKGFDIIPVIRRFEAHRDTPIIFLTGNATRDNLIDAFRLGACDFITKPIDRDVLLEKIKIHIVRKKLY